VLIRMRRVACATSLVLMLATITFCQIAFAQDEHILHNFANNGKDGYGPIGAVSFDDNGSMWGTTAQGGVYNAGSVFKMNSPDGPWSQEAVAHSFSPNNGDGYEPYGGVIVPFTGFGAPIGNAYGTTFLGGANGAGTVYALSPTTNGKGFTESLVHSFNANGSDGANPANSLIVDGSGNLYGTTVAGGTGGAGTVFELESDGSGGFTELVLHSFSNNGVDGAAPWSTLLLDSSGNLLGTTTAGGAYGCGTVFELIPQSDLTWSESVLHSFAHDSSDGCHPLAGLAPDTFSSENFWGTTNTGGTYNFGTVYYITNSSGNWTETVAYSFANNGDGAHPGYGTLVTHGFGNESGVTIDGGAGGVGAVYTWGFGGVFAVNYSFRHDRKNDGYHPYSGPAGDLFGNLYGTTRDGGTGGGGIVYKEAPGPN
jgi:uncharacterized repeat protein (TIGR03803 family)